MFSESQKGNILCPVHKTPRDTRKGHTKLMFLQLFVGHFNELVFFSFRDLFGEDPAEIAFRVREARISFVSGHSSFSFQVSIIIQCGSGVDFIKVGPTA